jgi:hypothetical protein
MATQKLNLLQAAPLPDGRGGRSKSGTETLTIVDRITTGQRVVESPMSNGIVCRNTLIACFNSGSVAPVAA